jgi:hypothetical protein
MPLNRRDFLKTSLAASATAALAVRMAGGESAASAGREYYELRCYHLKADTRLKADANPARLDAYLEGALLPALGHINLTNIGVFTELDVNKESATAVPKPGSPVWVLIPHPSLTSFMAATAALRFNPPYPQASADYFMAPKASPAFERIDSWLLLAFAGLPRLELPAFSRERVPTRVFEMRDYESHSELKALGKMAMFDDGEIALMKDLGMAPLCFGQALAGPNLPHLRYITGGPDLATHLANWKRFGPDPRWIRMKNDPRYADTVSKNTARFLTPKAYSQI